MRHHFARVSLTALVSAASLLTTSASWADVATLPAYKIGTAATPTSVGSAASTISTAAQQRVTYGGLALDVPNGWAVVDLSAHPTTCVRFDVHVVYLGTPGAVQDCPAVVEGHTEAILLQPTPSDPPAGAITVIPGAAPTLTWGQLLAGEVIAQISGTGIQMTAALGTDPTVAQDVFRSLTSTPNAPRPLAATPNAPRPLVMLNASLPAAATVPTPLDRSFTWYYGSGFDACTAPALSTMQTWRDFSPYRSIGIYIGGNSRGCDQANLTASWVRSIATMGWKAQPVYVGVQAPCSTTVKATMTPGLEAAQGRDSALDAVAQATALGIGSGSDIYYDMEAYTRSSACSGSVLTFLSAWTSTLHANGYSSGVYSSVASGIQDVANPTALPGFVPPDKIWIAQWKVPPNVYGHAPYVADSQFSPYRRIHQYLGGHPEAYGAITINIDNNLLDTDSNRGNPFGSIDAVTTGPSKVTAAGWAIDPDTSSPIMVQMYVDGLANAVTWADQPRSDVGVAFPAAGPNHGYSLTMASTPGRHTVCLYAINAGPGFSRQLGCRVVTVLSSDPFGSIDAVTTGFNAGSRWVTASGWAIDPDTSSPILVQMYIDSRANTVTWAGQPRPDVGAVFPAAGPNHGYSLTMATTPGSHTVCLYAINTGPGTSRPLGCRAVNVR